MRSRVCACTRVCAYLGGLLWRVAAHHVVSEQLLEKLDLGHADVDVQATGHVHLQRVTTHHYLLEGQRGEEERERCI